MNKIYLTILFYVSFSSFSLAQNNIELITFEPSECLAERNLQLIQKRIVTQEIVNDTFRIEVATWLNCGLSEIGKVKMNGDTLLLTSTEKPFVSTSYVSSTGDTIWEDREVVACDCCFHFKYVIAGITQLPEFVKLNNEIIQLNNNVYLPPTYKSYFGDSLVVSDSEGFYYRYSFYDSHKLKRIRKTKGGYWETVTFYENGAIKKESKYFGDFDKFIETSYDEKGNVLEHISTVDEN